MGLPKGFKHSEETKQKMSVAAKGNKNNLGQKRSEITKEKLRQRALEYWANPEIDKSQRKRSSTVFKPGQAPSIKGKTHTKKAREKMSKKLLARWKNPEYRNQQTQSHLGNKLSEETKQKLRIIHKGILAGENNPRWKGGKESYCSRIAHNVWEDYWREMVPKGYVIHHIDEDITNNHVANLLCLPAGKHTALHANRRSSGYKQLIPTLAYADSLA